MIKGHLDQRRQHQRSTKTTNLPAPIEIVPDDDSFPPQDMALPTGKRSHFCFAAIMEPTGQVYSDQTGRFITPSSTGNNYLVIVYGYDSNSILAKPIKYRSATSILNGYKTIHAKLCNAGQALPFNALTMNAP